MDVEMSADVRAVLGPEGMRHVAAGRRVDTPCAFCGEVIGPDETPTVVLTRNSHAVHAMLMHPRCAPSQVVDVADGVDLTPGDADGIDIAVTPILAGPAADAPVLIAEVGADMFVEGDSAGDLVDIVAAALLSSGFALATTLDDPPPQPRGWGAVLQPAAVDGRFAALHIVDAAGQAFYDGTVEAHDAWLAAAARGAIAVYVGPVGIAGQTLSERACRDALDRALRTGRVVAARVPLVAPAGGGDG